MPEILPKITVVTPSYNQAKFLEQTILSVIGQEYPNLEYILMDGGSNDGSIDIIKNYEQHFTYWQSEKDNGQSAAINAGFARGTGDILCWLNSDDMFMPGALLKIGRIFKDITEPTIIFGNCLHFHENSSKTRGSDVVKSSEELELEICNYMIQPSSFWNQGAWEKTGRLNESYHYGMDWEWFVRAQIAGITFRPVKDYLSLYRIHEAHKSGIGGEKRDLEIVKMYETYTGEKLKKAFIKWSKYKNKFKWLGSIVYASNLYQLTFIIKIIWFLFFQNLSFKQFKNMILM